VERGRSWDSGPHASSGRSQGEDQQEGRGARVFRLSLVETRCMHDFSLRLDSLSLIARKFFPFCIRASHSYSFPACCTKAMRQRGTAAAIRCSSCLGARVRARAGGRTRSGFPEAPSRAAHTQAPAPIDFSNSEAAFKVCGKRGGGREACTCSLF
jgi:hypothetical protein